MIATHPRVNLLDTWVDNINMGQALERIDSFIRAGKPRQVVTVNLDFLRLTQRDRSFQDVINSADMVVPDGMPLVWGARLQGEQVAERVAGVDLVRECAGLAAERGYSIFLLGAGPGIAENAASVLRAANPGLRIMGNAGPSRVPMSADDEAEVFALIQDFKPDMLFVAFGAPYQDQWIRSRLQELNVPVCMGVGGTLDMLTGRLSRAPQWMQDAGLEWFHRLRLEPGRLAKRYFVHDLPVFLRLMISCSFRSPSNMKPLRVPERLNLEVGDVANDALPVFAP